MILVQFANPMISLTGSCWIFLFSVLTAQVRQLPIARLGARPTSHRLRNSGLIGVPPGFTVLRLSGFAPNLCQQVIPPAGKSL
jgi:hypothetical protein